MIDGDAPSGLEELARFVNTLDIEAGSDALKSAADAERWLRGVGWLDETDGIDQAIHADVIRLREALRDLATVNAGHGDAVSDAGAIRVIGEIGARHPLLIETDEGRPRLCPAESGGGTVVGRLLAAYYRSSVEGKWPRLKACGNHECRWAYIDASRNASRRWCTSSGCGNLMAVRAYRARQRESRST